MKIYYDQMYNRIMTAD